MSKKDSFRDFVLEQLGGIPKVVARPMFGGLGLYDGGCFFGIVYKGAFYLKVDDRSRSDYEAAGMRPFRPFAGRPTTMQYYEVPPRVLEDAEELAVWVAKAIDAAAGKPRRAAPKRRLDGSKRRLRKRPARS